MKIARKGDVTRSPETKSIFRFVLWAERFGMERITVGRRKKKGKQEKRRRRKSARISTFDVD